MKSSCGTPIENVYVLAFDIVTMEDAYTITDSSYVIDNLPDSDYYVFFDGATVSCNYGYYDVDAASKLNLDISQADLVTVTGGITALPDVSLECSCGPLGSIDGRMTDGSVGIPGHVDVYDENYKWVAFDRIEVTDDGQYKITGLDASKNYKLFFDADTEYISQWYYGAPPPPSVPFPPGDFCTADKVSIPPALPPNVQLTKGSTISGEVKDAATGNPMAGVFVDVYNEKYDSLYEFDYTDLDGNYTLSGLPPGGGYKVRFKPANNLHAMQWCGGKYDFDHADPKATGGTGGTCDAQLALGGSVSGAVTSQKDNAPITFALVNAEVTSSKGTFSAVGTTDEHGNYTISGLPGSPGYKTQFIASFIEYIDSDSSKYYHVNEWYSGKANPATATQFTVPAPGIASGISAQLAVGGSISGKATNGLGDPVKGVMVEVYHDNAASSIAVAATDEQGNYIVTGVPYGKNKVRFFVDSQDGYCSPAHTCYVGWYGGFTPQDAILTASLRNITGIDAVLSSCGGISGTVTDGTNPVSGVRVEVYNRTLSPAGNVIASGITDKDGKYTIIGVPVSGVHKVKFIADSLGYKNQWYDSKKNSDLSDTVAVTASNITPNINAILKKEKKGSIVPIIETLLLP